MPASRQCFSRIAVVAALLTLAALRLHAQLEADPTPLLRDAIAKIEQAKQSTARFTWLSLEHIQNFDGNGDSTVDYTQLFEVTYIADLEFDQLLEIDGKPLAGKALADEKKRYDDAVRERSALDPKARELLQRHMHSTNLDFHLDLLPTQFRSIGAGRAPFDQRDCLLIDSVPLPGALTPNRFYRIWLDPVHDEILHVEFYLLGDEAALRRGAAFSLSWTYHDGIPLISQSHGDFSTLVDEKKTVHVIGDHTNSRFRKFIATTRILPGESSPK